MELNYSAWPEKTPDELQSLDPCVDVNDSLKLKMDKMQTYYSSVFLLSVIQIQHVFGTGCNIVSVTSPSASTLSMTWNSYSGASSYLLDLSVLNSTSIATVVVVVKPPSTQRLVQGLRAGQIYVVTMKVFQFYTAVCTDIVQTMTVPATSQIIFSKAISSTSIRFEWSSVEGADSYILFVEELFSYSSVKFNQTFTTLGGQVDGLTPSQTYTCYLYSSNSAGMGARSITKTIMTLVQPPTGVNLEPTGKSTAHLTWNSVSKVLLYQVTVMDTDPRNPPVFRNTSATSMDISDLEPCSTYTVGVSSVNMFLVPGEASNVIHVTSAINPVKTISVDYSCSSGTVTVKWGLVFGANVYWATAVDGTGASLNCTSNSTSCQITMLKCGEEYLVHVAAFSDDCQSISNTSATFETVPCAPDNLQTIHQCSSNVIIFKWEPTNNTYYYVATGVDDTGKSTECRTADTMCFFTNTGCGQLYTYNVYAVSHCNSEVSRPEFVRTSPCLPTNVRTGAECHYDKLRTTWDTAAGALSYTVEAQGNTGELHNCTSTSNSCEVTGVPCGEHLSVWITASNSNCSTNKVLGEVAQTVPCAPSIGSVSVDCSPDSANVSWTTSIGSTFYMAIAQDTDGNTNSCNSMGTNCLIKGLRCAQNYTANVIGSNLQCNSTVSEDITFTTAPCPPDNVLAQRDCDANHAVIEWQNHLSTGNYTATIEDQSGATISCVSNTVNSCTIHSLPCGKRYTVTVTYNDGNCLSISAPISMDSVPCGPENVSAIVTCITGELTVTWDIPDPAENYTATISRGLDQVLHCNSTETTCTSEGLLCGSSYMVTVYSITGKCFSLPSTVVTVQTLPCPPTYVITPHTCAPDPVHVTWTASDSAKYYNAVAVSDGGHRSECTTNNTSCSLPGLQCGEIYTVVVSGADDNCTGQMSETVFLLTEPCPPSNVFSDLICSTGTAQVFWAPSANAVSYALTATSSDQILTCSSSNTNCTLSNLICGQPYNIVVNATDGTCVSNFSAPFRQDKVPCAPVNVSTNLLCGTNDLTVSWIPFATPFNYSVSAVPLDVNRFPVICDTSHASCSLGGLECGQTYNVSVKASYGNCSGSYSHPQTVQTGPCPPQSVDAVTECGLNSVLVSWSASLGATSYNATVTSPNGFSGTCSSSNLTCSVSGLQCASQYNITVTSQDSQCTSSPSQTVVTTGPCDPVSVTSVLHCGSDMASVSWEPAAGALSYTLLAQEGSSQHYTSCWSNTTSCQLNQLQCGTFYYLTVMAEDATCNSTGSTNIILVTVPCSPSIQNSTLICGTDSSLVTWMPMANATGYVVNATSKSGHTASCSSAAATCTLTDLLCSETYSTTVTAQGRQCDSAPSSITNITTSPCPPTIISKQYTCSNNTAEFSWTDPVGRLTFVVQVEGDEYQYSFNATNTTCLLRNLPCGLDLNLTVQAQGLHCNSIPSVSESLPTVPCTPTNVITTLVCLNQTALVSWIQSSSATGYNVTLMAQNGYTHHCQSNSNSCQLLDIHCGETYNVTVTPYSDTCAGHPSAASILKAGLCAPSNVTLSSVCGDSTVSWSNVTGAEMFIVKATADDGHTHTCTANYSNSCNFTDLHCSKTYDVTVVTVDKGCWSKPSSAVQLRTALCSATNLTGQISCETNTMTLTWDQSPAAGATYSLEAERIGSTLPPRVLTTSNTSYTLTNLLCGERYSLRIAELDGSCRSSYSLPIVKSTAPCSPTNFTAHVDCGSDKGIFSWARTNGAASYTAQVTGEHGHIVSCSSNDTSCSMKLHCGRSYFGTLVASTESCNSSQHADITFDSAPCLSEGVLAELQCTTNVMNVSWDQTTGTDNYTAWAISTDGHTASCNSTNNTCSIHDLQCGKVYEVTVTSSSVDRRSIAGSDYMVQSAPCEPDNISVDHNCSSNVVTVKWNQSSTLQNYTVQATSALGVNSTCDSMESTCSFLDLSCGQIYTFTVMGHTNVCMSEISTSIENPTAPCPPTNVSAQLNCHTGTALISWKETAASVTTAYNVQATSMDGHNSNCSKIGTFCSLTDLVCGQDYSVVVEAIHTGCPGPASTPASLTTVPCPPTNISVHYNVSNAQVMWGAARGAMSYSALAVSDQVLKDTCNNSNTSCFLNNLQCGQIYNVTVIAHNLKCDSVASETYCLMTEPCPPTNIQANMECEGLTATVSWQQSDHAVGYAAYVDSQNGHEVSCLGTHVDTQCAVSGVMCGIVYNVWVKALGQKYNSSESNVTTLSSGPCPTSSIETVMDCEASCATISWQPSVGVISYVTELTSSSGHQTSCTTNHTNCDFSSLQCGEEYNVTVKVLGDTCNNSVQMDGYFTTEPCVPVNISLYYNVSTAKVMWGTAKGARYYMLQAATDQGLMVTCNTSSTICFLNGLQCGQIYNVTVVAQNSACNNTVTSEPYCLMTEPCPPTGVQTSMECEQLTATVSWQQSNNAVGYVAYFENQIGHNDSCVTLDIDTSCVVSGLMCDTVYSVWVKALGQLYNSSDSALVSLRSAPCLPTKVAVGVDCNSDGAAAISWNATHGMANFSITAIVNGGLQTLCTTEWDICHVSGLSCGESYNLSISATNNQCSLTAPIHANLTTRPCPPQHVAVDLQCGFHTTVLSWEERSDVELYKARAIKASGGEEHGCNSTASTCQFLGLDCGELYNFTVMAFTQGCSSQDSSTVFIQTDPCTTELLNTSVDCETKVVSLSWSISYGTERYMVSAKAGDSTTELSTNATTAHFSDLTCGQKYNLTVTPHSQQCPGISSAAASIQTWPCPPVEISALQDCLSAITMITWQASNGSDYYTATMQTDDGISRICMSESNGCGVSGLTCGRNFSVSVTASNSQCNITSSQTTGLQSVPCAPTNVSVLMDCTNNTALASWDGSQGVVHYRVTAHSSHSNVSCHTSGLNCSLDSLTCGNNYTIQVVAMDNNCSSVPSQTLTFNSAPCPPQNVSAEVSCLSNDMTVSWDATGEADHFLVTVFSDNGGTSETLSITDTECSIHNMTCGDTLRAHVTSVRDNCSSQHSLIHNIKSAPCQPQGINGSLDCVTNSAWISWEAAIGADTYYVSAAGGSNYNASCTTSSNTTCEVEDLACGVLYNFSIIAKNSMCDSQPSATIDLQTAPCTLGGITAVPQCHNSSILVMWNLMDGSEGDTVYTITAEDRNHNFLYCTNTGTSCYLQGAQCDHHYSIIVAASSDTCSSMRSPPYKISMEPCPPTNVVVNASCEDHSALVSWSPSPVAETYHTVALAEDGHMHTCNTTSSGCSIFNLHCDEQYIVFVTACHENCSSKASRNVTINTGPCQPGGLSVTYHCNNQSALLSWTPDDTAVEYYGCALDENGDKLFCHSTNPSCTIQGLDCRTSYNFSVQASDGVCNSSFGDSVQSGGAPCPPDVLEVQLMPMQEEIQVLYFEWTPIICEDTEYKLKLTGTLLGDAQAQFELSSYQTNSTYFEIPLPCGSAYNATVESRNAAGISDPSVPFTGTTAPCPPSGAAFNGDAIGATVSWDASVFATTYTVYDNSVSPKAELCSTPDLVCSLSNVPSTDLVITASNAAGESETVNIII